MKKLFVLSLLTVFALTGSTQETDEEAKPKISFEKMTHKFGKITEGTKASHKFKFTNEGDAPLVIKNVQPSCGCTTPKWPKKPIMPGESDVIKAVYNSKGRPGNFHKTVTVKTNLPENSKKVLHIKGNVKSK